MNWLLPLYKKTSTGASQSWLIGVDGTTIVTRWGQIDGAIQETRDLIKAGKNAGRSNATSAHEQAQLEAQSQWEKKLKKGYVKDLDDARAGKTDEVIAGGIFPMLAKSYDKDGDKIRFPAFTQPKFDGHRCIATIKSREVSLWSRTRKPITGLPHIVRAIEQLGIVSGTLDGELYNHDYRQNFEELSSFIRTPEPKEGHEVVQYHVYDVENPDVFRLRHQRLQKLGMKAPLVSVETVEVADEDELMLAFERFTAQGYEGCMVRNADGLYVNKRSADLQKVKEFEDAEFEVVGVEAGRGKLSDCAIFVCKTADGTDFRAKMKGETDKLRGYLEQPETAIGRQLTVKYQGVTNKNRVPRFPVALRFRDSL